jgi:hypothetical protein
VTINIKYQSIATNYIIFSPINEFYETYAGADPGFVVRGGVSRRGVWSRVELW